MPSSSDSSSWYTSTAQSGPLLLMQHSHPTLAFKPLILFPPTVYFLALHPYHRLMLLVVSLYHLLPLPLRKQPGPGLPQGSSMECWGLLARSTELLRFISSHPVYLICIQKSNLNLFSSFRIPGFSALQSDGTHSRSGIFFTNVTDASGGFLIFVGQGLSFSELSTSFLSLLDPYSDYVDVNISLNDSSSHFLMFMLPLFALLRRIAEPISFLPRFFPPGIFAVEFSRFRFHRKRTASTASSFSFHNPG